MHQRTTQYRKGEERKRQRLEAEEESAATSRAFRAYGRPMDMVTSFKYLEWVISAADNDWTEVVRNLAKARAVWRRLARILIREGAKARVFTFYLNLWSSRCYFYA